MISVNACSQQQSWNSPVIVRKLLPMGRFAATLILCLFAATWATAQQSNAPVLTVRLRSEQESYSIRDEIRLELQRENAGAERLAVTRDWGWGAGRTNIRVFDADGKEVTTDFSFDEVPPPPQLCDFVVLDKGDFIGMRLHEPLSHFVNKPGRYELVLEYTSYLSAKYARKALRLQNLPFWSRERGTTMSNRITVVVTE
jgi:hypothetical protein